MREELIPAIKALKHNVASQHDIINEIIDNNEPL